MSERTEESLKARVRETPLIERLNESRKRIAAMCSERRGPKMTIPVQYYDDDFFICATLEDARDEVARVRGETWREAEQYANECEAVNTERGSILAWHKMAAHCRMQAKNLPTNQPTWSRRFSTMRQIVTDCA